MVPGANVPLARSRFERRAMLVDVRIPVLQRPPHSLDIQACNHPGQTSQWTAKCKRQKHKKCRSHKGRL